MSDFGFSIQLPETQSKTLVTVGPGEGLPGTPGYRAPEYNDGHYSTLSDVYSYGVVCDILMLFALHTFNNTMYNTLCAGSLGNLHWSFGLLKRKI